MGSHLAVETGQAALVGSKPTARFTSSAWRCQLLGFLVQGLARPRPEPLSGPKHSPKAVVK